MEERNVQALHESKLKKKNQLLASRSNKLKRFGDLVPDLMSSINEACATGRFLKRPVGPIGKCISSLFIFSLLLLYSKSKWEVLDFGEFGVDEK